MRGKQEARVLSLYRAGRLSLFREVVEVPAEHTVQTCTSLSVCIDLTSQRLCACTWQSRMFCRRAVPLLLRRDYRCRWHLLPAKGRPRWNSQTSGAHTDWLKEKGPSRETVSRAQSRHGQLPGGPPLSTCSADGGNGSLEEASGNSSAVLLFCASGESAAARGSVVSSVWLCLPDVGETCRILLACMFLRACIFPLCASPA